MNNRSWRTLGWALSVMALLTCASVASAFVKKPQTDSLDSKVFFKPDLHISSSNVKLAEVTAEAASPAWNRFFAAYGRDFEVYLDPRSGTPTSIVGRIPIIPGDGVGNRLTLNDMSGSLERSVRVVDADVVADAVLQFAAINRDVLHMDTTQLGTPRVDQINPDLWQVSIPQRVNGVPVRYGRLAATISHGNIIVMGTESWGDVHVDTTPQITSEHAMDLGFNYAQGRLASDRLWMKPSLEIVPFAPVELQNGESFSGPIGQGYGHRLVWSFGFLREGDDASWEVTVDAHTGEVLELKDSNNYISKRITGGIYPVTNTGVCPDNARCGTIQSGSPMPWANTGFAAPNDFTNSAGVYDYSSGTLTTTLNGKFVKITDTCGAISESSATGNLDLGGVNDTHDCTSAGTSPGDTPASRSAFYEINKLKELARGWLPSNVWLQAQITSNVNLNQTCNAFYSPSTGQVNFYRQGGGCRNTGEIAAVFDHEWGHGLDDNDTTGNLSNSSETYADVTAILRLQQSCVGYGFWFTSDQGCGMTTDGTGFNGDNSQQGTSDCELDCSGVRGADWDKHADHIPDTPANFACSRCLSGSGPCGREVHCDAMPASEAAWDFAARDLQAPPFNYDSATAFIVANKVFYQGSGNIGNWVTCTCPSTSNGCGATNAYLQWLAADDDNGTLLDGTPHMTAIFAAFDRHGYACSTPVAVNSGCVGGPTAAPTVTLGAGSNQITVNWTSVPGATSYWVMRSEGFAGCNFGKARLATVIGNSYVDNGVANGTPYYYTVVAQGGNESCYGVSSACVSATPQPCAGAVSVNKSTYNCSDFIGINLVDSDLIGAGTQNVTIRSTTESTPETITLTESPANSGQFSGSYLTSGPPPSNGDGYVSVVNGDTITVKYSDASFCGPPQDVETTASVDCVGPVISNVHATNVTGNSATILWDTNEPADSNVTYDTTTPPAAGSAGNPALVTGHTILVGGLQPCTHYYYYVGSIDFAGNSASDTNGGVYYDFTTGVNVNPSYTNSTVMVINDNATINSVIAVADNKTVLDIDVKVNITHTYDGDLLLTLIGPNNVARILSNRRGTGGDNFINTVFDDEATTPIASGTAPFTGSFKPDEALSALDGINATGNWTLRVADQAGADTGTLNNWTLTLTYPSQACGSSLAYYSSTKSDACNGTGSGGGNNTVEPGEDVVIPITARANGTSGVTGVSATLTTSTPGVTVTDNYATYPDIPSDGTAQSNPDHFRVHIDSGVACGTNANFSIHFAANEGNWNDFFSFPIGAPGGDVSNSYSSTDVPKVINDNSTVTSNLVVNDTYTVNDVDVTIGNITHTYDGDLVVTLIGPTGTRTTLSNRRGAGGDNFVNTVFSDEATTPIANGAAPFTGAFKPDALLSTQDGVSSNGTWKLEVADMAGADTGALNAWSITLSTPGAPICNICASALAGEADDLRWTSGFKNQLQWGAAPNASSYTLYRGVKAGLSSLLTPAVDSCTRLTTPNLDSGHVLTESPAIDAIYWYLITGSNGSGEGSAGNATAGQRQVNSSGACPP